MHVMNKHANMSNDSSQNAYRVIFKKNCCDSPFSHIRNTQSTIALCLFSLSEGLG